MIWLFGSMKIEQKMGLRIDPWGTPQEIIAKDENELPKETEKVLLEIHQSRGVPVTPTQCLRHQTG